MKAIILAGGRGERLWPLSRDRFSKQFINFFGKKTLLEATYERTAKFFDPKDIITITNKDYYFYVEQTGTKISPEIQKNIICEPERKNTAPAIALACQYTKEKQKAKDNEIIFVFPADHFIEPLSEVKKMIASGVAAAKDKHLVVFGTKPHRPDTGFGYIKIGEDCGKYCKVGKFVEKPDLAKAQEYLKSGDYYWNAGIFAFSLDVFFKELAKYSPEVNKILNNGYDWALENFSKMPSISIDYALMEKTEMAAVVKTQTTWADLGSWDSFYDISKKDKDNNVIIGNVKALGVKDSLVFGNQRLIAALNVDNLLIVGADDTILVCKRDSSQDVKKIFQILQSEKRGEALEPKDVYRNWGKYQIIESGAHYKVKKVIVNPKESLSLQMHHKRSEHWVVIRGQARITIASAVYKLKTGESAFVPPKTLHRLENPFNEPLEIIEVQNGVCEEEDIVRFQDKYGRVRNKK